MSPKADLGPLAGIKPEPLNLSGPTVVSTQRLKPSSYGTESQEGPGFVLAPVSTFSQSDYERMGAMGCVPLKLALHESVPPYLAHYMA